MNFRFNRNLFLPFDSILEPAKTSKPLFNSENSHNVTILENEIKFKFPDDAIEVSRNNIKKNSFHAHNSNV